VSDRRNDESGFRHLMRVRLGVNGAKGRLYRCTSRRGYEFWRVKLADRTWAWPADCVQDGEGDTVTRCGDCDMRFISDGSSPLCRYCNPSAFGRRDEQIYPF
jgi:hypothetical protein